MTLYTPSTGLTFVDLSAAPVNVMNETTAAGDNLIDFDIDYPDLITAEALYAYFLITVDKADVPSDTGNLNIVTASLNSIIQISPFTAVGAPFNCYSFVFCNFDSDGFFSDTTILQYNCNNLGGGQSVTTVLDLYGYFIL